MSVSQGCEKYALRIDITENVVKRGTQTTQTMKDAGNEIYYPMSDMKVDSIVYYPYKEIIFGKYKSCW